MIKDYVFTTINSRTVIRVKFFGVALATTLLLTPAALRAQTWTLDIAALIDGRDQLIIQGNSLTWHHFDYAAVGRHEGANEPTVITTSLDGQLVMDHLSWIPDWPEPPPAEIRYEALSSTFSLVTPTMPQMPTWVSLDVIQAREALTIFQLPDAANNYTAILEFDDNLQGGPEVYQAHLIFSTVPEPSTLCMIALAGTLLGMARRRLPSLSASPPRFGPRLPFSLGHLGEIIGARSAGIPSNTPGAATFRSLRDGNPDASSKPGRQV
jgi:hypothetical protein